MTPIDLLNLNIKVKTRIGEIIDELFNRIVEEPEQNIKNHNLFSSEITTADEVLGNGEYFLSDDIAYFMDRGYYSGIISVMKEYAKIKVKEYQHKQSIQSVSYD